MLPHKLLTQIFFLVAAFVPPSLSAAAEQCVGAKFASSEHKQLGDSAFKLSCSPSGVITNCEQYQMPREDEKYNYSYGDLITLGDFFKDPIEAYKDTTLTNNLDHVFECIDKEGRALFKQKEHPEADYPDCNWVYIGNVRDFLSLASSNDNHFAWYNIKAYIEYHTLALAYANEASLSQNHRLLKKAIFINGVADHYLSDAFAAGHVRVPRKHIRDWVFKNIKGPFKRYVADAFAMILHDHDGKNRAGKEIGLKVRNARGDVWVTHSDFTLNQCRPDTDLSIQLPIEALSLSLAEVLMTYKTGELPMNVFAALRLVPYAISNEILEHYKFGGDKKSDAQIVSDLRNSLPVPLKVVLSKAKLKRLLENLGQIQMNFIHTIRTDIEADPNLKSRLPNEYWQSLANTLPKKIQFAK